jgi:hypothetical protein
MFKKKDKLKQAENITKLESQEILREKRLKRIKEKERREFEESLAGFDFNELITISLPKKNSEIFYEEIDIPTKIRIVLLVSDHQSTIKFAFQGPSKDKKYSNIHSISDKNFYSFEYNCEILGEYVIILTNSNDIEVKVTIGIKKIDNNEDNIGVEKNSFDAITMQLNNMEKELGGIQIKQNMINKINNGHISKVNGHNNKIIVFAIVEVLFMIGILIVQLVYIKGLVNKF